MSNVLDWAKREVEIACKKENPNRKEGEFDYGCACYESALKAFESLLEDGHSGFSIKMTQAILIRLLDGQPLTPIEDTDDIWNECSRPKDGPKVYQCKRMNSLFKDVYADGKETEKMTLYVVHGNTYYGGYGHVENIFGVYTEKDSAEAAKDLIEKRLYEENKDREWSIVDDLSDIAVGILEIEANEILDIELGGYCE